MVTRGPWPHVFVAGVSADVPKCFGARPGLFAFLMLAGRPCLGLEIATNSPTTFGLRY